MIARNQQPAPVPNPLPPGGADTSTETVKRVLAGLKKL